MTVSRLIPVAPGFAPATALAPALPSFSVAAYPSAPIAPAKPPLLLFAEGLPAVTLPTPGTDAYIAVYASAMRAMDAQVGVNAALLREPGHITAGYIAEITTGARLTSTWLEQHTPLNGPDKFFWGAMRSSWRVASAGYFPLVEMIGRNGIANGNADADLLITSAGFAFDVCGVKVVGQGVTTEELARTLLRWMEPRDVHAIAGGYEFTVDAAGERSTRLYAGTEPWPWPANPEHNRFVRWALQILGWEMAMDAEGSVRLIFPRTT